MTNHNQSSAPSPKRSKAQRVAAMICVILLAGLYLTTLIVAIIDRSSSGKWFFICLVGTLAVPLLTWIYIWMYGVLTQKKTIASFDLGNSALQTEEMQKGEENPDLESSSPNSQSESD